jgi:translation initiation factor 2A
MSIAYPRTTSVRVHQAESAVLLQELTIPNVVELRFSPRGTYLSTWERPVKLEDGAQHKNLRVFSVSTGEELISFSQKYQDVWDLQYTISESHAIRLAGSDIQVFSPSDWGRGIVDKLKVEGASSVTLSPGLNPSIAVFIPEKKGQPANVRIHALLNLSSPPTCQKTFFKAEKSQIKWNNLGTQVLVLTQTDVDSTNKSYYGQSGLYILSTAGNFDCRINLDKEGPIHDFSWSPNSKEFGVVYGCRCYTLPFWIPCLIAYFQLCLPGLCFSISACGRCTTSALRSLITYHSILSRGCSFWEASVILPEKLMFTTDVR